MGWARQRPARQIRRPCRAALPSPMPPPCSHEASLQSHVARSSMGALGEENLARTSCKRLRRSHASLPPSGDHASVNLSFDQIRRGCRAALPPPTPRPCSQDAALPAHVETFGNGALARRTCLTRDAVIERLGRQKVFVFVFQSNQSTKREIPNENPTALPCRLAHTKATTRQPRGHAIGSR